MKTRKHEIARGFLLRIPSPFSTDLEDLIHQVIGCCITVHRVLGPGLVETVYQRAVCCELEANCIQFEREKAVPIMYRGKQLFAHRLDLVVSEQLLVELKAVERLHPVHHAQVLSELRASRLRVALLVNFNVPLLPQGIKRIVL